MNQLRGILLGLVLISGTLTPSFAQTSDYSDGPYFSFFKLLKYLFSSKDVTIITNSDSILDSDKTVIIRTSSITNHTGDKTGDKIKDKTTNHDTDDFYHGLVHVSSNTSTETSVGKITLCHVPPGNPSKSHSISIASPSVSAHLAHGDYLGTCDDSDDDTNDHPILGFDKAKVITSSNTGVIQIYKKILDLQSNPSISLENLKNQVSSVANLYKFLADADKQDRKEFQELFHDYKEIVKQLLKKADEQSKRAIENILEQAEDAFKAQHNHEKDHQDEKESKHKENHQDKKDKDHKDKKDKDHKDKKDNH
jgi:hypothetical protein